MKDFARFEHFILFGGTRRGETVRWVVHRLSHFDLFWFFIFFVVRSLTDISLEVFSYFWPISHCIIAAKSLLCRLQAHLNTKSLLLVHLFGCCYCCCCWPGSLMFCLVDGMSCVCVCLVRFVCRCCCCYSASLCGTARLCARVCKHLLNCRLSSFYFLFFIFEIYLFMLSFFLSLSRALVRSLLLIKKWKYNNNKTSTANPYNYLSGLTLVCSIIISFYSCCCCCCCWRSSSSFSILILIFFLANMDLLLCIYRFDE